jgi:hypothetical protein
MTSLVAIGVEEPWLSKIRAGVDPHVIAYPGVPHMYSLDGKLRIESVSVTGKFLEGVRGVIYYRYFPNAEFARRAIALSDVPTFPDVRSTILLDDRVNALVAALRFDTGPRLPRGYFQSGKLMGDYVAKWSDEHAGEGKARTNLGFVLPDPAIVEPFVHGRSERILLIENGFGGYSVWHLQYESADWRKNVRGTVSRVERINASLVDRAVAIARGLRLDMAGVDFIVDPVENKAYLLEVNAYPGFEGVPEAAEAFAKSAIAWAGDLK